MSLVTQCLIGQLNELFLVHIVVTLGSTIRPTNGRTPGHISAAFVTLLGLNHDNTVSTTGTIQSSCRCILQHGHRFDIVGVDIAQVAVVGNTINHIQRVVVGID